MTITIGMSKLTAEKVAELRNYAKGKADFHFPHGYDVSLSAKIIVALCDAALKGIEGEEYRNQRAHQKRG